ncbi:MAG: cupin domain-containing protein [Propionibacteriales bacterium]|nr:cupin domain-containing protein [Propionibacteriales bacterium]
MSRKTEREFKVHSYVQYMRDKYDPYRKWLEGENLPVIGGEFVQDVRTLELAPWDRRGGSGAYLVFSDQHVADAYVCEIPAAGSLKPQRQLYEEIVVVASGRGATTLWWDADGPRHTFEWQRGSLFAIPLNCWHEHFNVSGDEPARFVALTSAPVAWELYRDHDFIFNTDHAFRDRFDANVQDLFSQPGKYLTNYYGGILDTNLVSDLREVKLVPREKRGAGTRNMYIHLVGSTMFAHISEFPVGTYKKAHRHGPGAHIYTLDSTGYTMMWKEGEKPKRYDWSEGSVISPPAGYWHQHYNTGHEPAKFVALHASIAVSGGDSEGLEQIDFSEEDSALREMYIRECEKNGVPVQIANSSSGHS